MIDSAQAGSPAVLSLNNVTLQRGDKTLLDSIDWEVRSGEHWVVLGPNGGGKTSLVSIASFYVHPSQGQVVLEGEVLGRTDVRTLRTRIGLASSALAEKFRDQLTPAEIVMMARYAALEPWWHQYTDDDRRQARLLLDRFGVATLADRPFATLSSGEKQRVLLARTLMCDPAIVILDEPTAGLDLAGREGLVSALADWASDPTNPPSVLVTHHVDEIPPGYTHALLLANGRVTGHGALAEVLTPDRLSLLFGLDLDVQFDRGRWSARAR